MNHENKIKEIDKLNKEIDKFRPIEKNLLNQIKEYYRIGLTYSSNAIEGNTLTETETKVVLEDGLTIAGKPLRDHYEATGHSEAYDMVYDLAKKKTITEKDILKIHKLFYYRIDQENAGHYRKVPVVITGTEYVPPAPSKVPALMKKFVTGISSLRKKYHPVEVAALIHKGLVDIHPFVDGNGRMARLLASLLLYQRDWDFRKIIVLEDFYNQDRQAYYNALNIVQGNKYHEGEDLTPWVEYFIEGFLVEARQVNEKIALMGFGKVSEAAEQIFLDRDEIQIMDFLATTGRITSQDVREILGVAKRTAQLKLKNLTDKGLLKSQGSGPSTYHVLYGGERA